MATLIELQTQLDKLRTARASGVTRVIDGAKSVEYRSMAELETAIRRTVEDIARLTVAAGGTNVPARTMRTICAKGT